MGKLFNSEKKMIKIVTDGAADMPADWERAYEIHILPLRITWGDETYVQGVDIDKDTFYRFVREKKIFPKTTLPSPQQVIDFYRSIAQKGDEILSVHLASKLSGTFSVINLAAQQAAGEFKITTFDSEAGSAALGFMCRDARVMERQGFSLPEILQRLETIRRQLAIIFTVDNLEFAHLSGRVNALQSALSSVLNIKPIIVLRDGLLYMAEKVRTRQRSINRVLEIMRQRMGDQWVNVAVVHAADLQTAQAIAERVKELFKVRELVITDLSIPVAAHLGPGTVGIVAYPVEEGPNG